jgi:ElaB/YqjD/DUF883 family membrane-anchored ribosome-binding protein
MSMETDSIEHKAEHHRARVDSTLDELRDRLSVGQIVDEVWAQLRQGQGGDMVKNIGRQVRDNPLALGLIGAGVAWLLAGEGVRAEGPYARRRYEAWADHAAEDDATGLRPRGGTTGRHGDTDGPGFAEKTKSAVSHLAEETSDAAGRLGEAIADTAEGVTDKASRVSRSISDTAAAAGEDVRYYGAEGFDAARHAVDEASRDVSRELYARSRRLRRSFLETLYEEPLIIGGLALAVGAAIGVSLPSTRREDQLLGHVRDDIRDAAYAYGEDVAERAGHVAEKAYEAASEEAEKKGLVPESGSGETLAEKENDIVRAAVEKAKNEAKKEGLT